MILQGNGYNFHEIVFFKEGIYLIKKKEIGNRDNNEMLTSGRKTESR